MRRGDAHPLRRERMRRNLSQRMLADFAGLGESTVVRAEAGKPIGAEARRRLCEYLGKSSNELGLVRSDGSHVDNEPDDGDESPPVIQAVTGSAEITRRAALKQLGAIGIGATGMMSGMHGLLSEEPWERLSRILQASFPVDDATLAHLRAITSSYWHLRVNRTSRELLGGILGHLHTITDMLDTPGSLANRRQLIVVAGEAALAGGQIAFDLNELAAARGYYRVAMEAAQEASIPDLGAVAVARASFTHTERGDAEGALLLVQRAHSLTQDTTIPIVRAWLHAIEAEGHANLGDSPASLAALDRSGDMLAHAMGKEDPYWTGFDAARLEEYRGVCLVRLGEPEKAVVAFERSLAATTRSPLRARPRILVETSTARVRQGEIEEACRLAAEALVVTQATHNAMMLPRLERLHRSLAPWRGTTSVKELHEQLLLVVP